MTKNPDPEPETAAFGRYELIRRIGIGGMAEVYLARAHGPEGFLKDLVVKVILPHLSDDLDFRTMFIDEAKIAAQLQHANVVQVYDLGSVDGRLYIAMELLDGMDLRQAFDRSKTLGRPFEVSDIIHITVEALKGLHYAHTRKSPQGTPLEIVHRDVSPANILMSLAGEVKIGDFGIAKAASSSNQTQAGMVKGKLRYMSYEQAMGMRNIDCRVDVYAMGMVLHTLLSGRHPYEGLGETEIAARLTAGSIPPPSDLNPEVPPGLDAIVAKATAKSLTERYPSAEAFQDDLEEFATGRSYRLGSRFLGAFLRSLSSTDGEIHTRQSPSASSGFAPRPIPAALRSTANAAAPAKPVDSERTRPPDPAMARPPVHAPARVSDSGMRSLVPPPAPLDGGGTWISMLPSSTREDLEPDPDADGASLELDQERLPASMNPVVLQEKALVVEDLDPSLRTPGRNPWAMVAYATGLLAVALGILLLLRGR